MTCSTAFNFNSFLNNIQSKQAEQIIHTVDTHVKQKKIEEYWPPGDLRIVGLGRMRRKRFAVQSMLGLLLARIHATSNKQSTINKQDVGVTLTLLIHHHNAGGS